MSVEHGVQLRFGQLPARDLHTRREPSVPGDPRGSKEGMDSQPISHLPVHRSLGFAGSLGKPRRPGHRATLAEGRYEYAVIAPMWLQARDARRESQADDLF